MNNTILNSLQLYTAKTAAGLGDQQMLYNLLLTKPFEVSTVLSHIFGGYKEEQYNVLDVITRGIGRIKTIEADNVEYTWRVDIDVDKAIPIVKAEWNGSVIAATDNPGISNTPIRIWLAERWFGPGAVIGFDNRDYQCLVQGEPEADGDTWIYTVVMADGKPESYVPPTYFTTGKKVHREGSAYPEGSEEADIVNYSAPFMLKNKITTMRLSYEVTRSAATTKMIIEYTNPKTGAKSAMWTDYQDWKALRQWYQTIDHYLVYSKYNSRPDGTVKVFGTNGRPVHIGAGLLEQIAPANLRTYTSLTTSLVMDYLHDLSFNKLGKGERKFLGLTGEMGMKAFDQMLMNRAAQFTLVDTKFVSGSGQDLTFGGQFTTYKMFNGMELTLVHFPWFDNTVYNRILDPITQRPASSNDILILDIGRRDGDFNLKKIVKKGSENLMWYTGGSIAPGMNMAKSTNILRSNAGDGYSVHFLTESGIMLTDPTTCGMLKYAVETT